MKSVGENLVINSLSGPLLLVCCVLGRGMCTGGNQAYVCTYGKVEKERESDCRYMCEVCVLLTA